MIRSQHLPESRLTTGAVNAVRWSESTCRRSWATDASGREAQGRYTTYGLGEEAVKLSAPALAPKYRTDAMNEVLNTLMFKPTAPPCAWITTPYR